MSDLRVYDDETLAKYRDGVDPMLYPNVDWYDLLKKILRRIQE